VTDDPESPSAILEATETWSGRATLLILAGIVLEIGLLFAFAHAVSIWEKVGLVTANVLIGVGLAIEYKCIRRSMVATAQLQRASDERVAAAEARASEADQKAAEAQLELARFRAPRLPTPEQLASLTEKLQPFAGTDFDTGLAANDGEQADFLWLLEPAIVAAGWNHRAWAWPGIVIAQGNRPPSGSVAVSGGVSIQVHPTQRERLLPIAHALKSALIEIGIAATVDTFNIHNNTPEAIHILIGRKR
jgi:hypothetical protein